MVDIVLGSGSKQRMGILDLLGLKYEVVKSLVDEESSSTLPYQYVMDLSKDKAKSVRSQLKDNKIIITADTIMYCDGKILEKPKSKEEVISNLKLLSNNINKCYTGVTITDMYQNKVITFYSETSVRFRKLSEEEIKFYLNKEENIYKCCGYVPGGKASLFIEEVNGDIYNLFGLPVNMIFNKLIELGYSVNDFNFIK